MIEITVIDHREQRITDAAVVLAPLGGEPVRLAFDQTSRSYRGDVAPGRYTASAQSPGTQRQERAIDVSMVETRDVFVLGPPELPYYYRGRVRVPFEPRPDQIAVLFRRPLLQPQRDLEQAASLFGIELVEVSAEIRRARGVLLKLPPASADRAAQAIGFLRGLPIVEHAGMVVGVRERSLSFLIEELIVRFEAAVPAGRIAELAARFQLQIVRAVPYSPNTWHFRAPAAPGYRLLDPVTRLADLPEVTWAEPNLVTTAELDAVVPTDFLWNAAWDRHLVQCPEAWQALQDAGRQAYGEPRIIIAAVDEGIESANGTPCHPDFQGAVSDGSPKVYQLFDFINLVPDNDKPIGTHGMGVGGVCSARADNPAGAVGVGEGLAGAAPNTRIMGLIYPSADIEQADMYVWASGFDPSSPLRGFPAPISPGADIINCSVALSPGAPISGIATAMLDFVTTYGRGGKGCLCFFSTGNENRDIFPTHRPWAAYQRSIAIAASTLDVDGQTEIRASTSGWGTNIQFCAPSHRGKVHNPPESYLTLSCAPYGGGDLIGHATAQTTLTAPAAVNATSLSVASVAGFAFRDRVLLGLPGDRGWEAVTVDSHPDPKANQMYVSALRNPHGAGTPVSTGPRGWDFFGGTSSATPLAAGIAALVLSADPALTLTAVLRILRDTARKIDPATTEVHPDDPAGDFRWRDANGDVASTTRLPVVWSLGFGYGRLNAAAAVRLALAR